MRKETRGVVDVERKKGRYFKQLKSVFASKESALSLLPPQSLSIYNSICLLSLLFLSPPPLSVASFSPRLCLFSWGTRCGASVLTSMLARSGGLPNQIIK